MYKSNLSHEALLNLDDYEQHAKSSLPKDHYDYYDSGTTVLAANATQTYMTVSMMSNESLEKIAEIASQPLWLQLYFLNNHDDTLSIVRRAEAADYSALVIVAGSRGVEQVINILCTELANAMALCGFNIIQEMRTDGKFSCYIPTSRYYQG